MRFHIVFESMFWTPHGWGPKLHAFTYITRAHADAACAKCDGGAKVVSV